MYKIIKDGAVLAMTEAPVYVRRAENGCLALCQEPEAEGINCSGQVFHLLGRPELEEAVATVMLEAADAGGEIAKAAETSGILFVAAAEAGTVDDATAGEHADLFAPWAYPVEYKVGQIRRYGGILYRCTQKHTSQADYSPDKAVSLWSVTADPTEEWPAWSQPVGAHNVYRVGAKVSHQEKHWVSAEDNNVWEPGVYGWDEAAEEE